MSDEVDEQVIQAYHNGLRDAHETWEVDKAALEAEIERLKRENILARGMANHYQKRAKQYEDWHDDALNKLHAIREQLRQYAEPEAVVIEAQQQLADANRWIEEYRIENRRLRGE